MNTEQVLRSLDPSTEPTEVQQRRSDALLERIVVVPVDAMTPRSDRAVRPRRGAWRIGALVTVGVTVAVVAIAVPGLVSQSSAVASWTAEPEAVSPSDLAVAESACREQILGTQDSTSLPLTISERRGDVVALLFYRDDPETSSTCVLDLPPGAQSPDEIAGGIGGGSGPSMAAADNSYLVSMEGQFTIGGQIFSVGFGSIGEGVASVTVRSGDDAAVATIAHGKYVAWIPGPVGDLSAEDRSGATLSYDLLLNSGAVLRDALPDAQAAE